MSQDDSAADTGDAAGEDDDKGLIGRVTDKAGKVVSGTAGAAQSVGKATVNTAKAAGGAVTGTVKSAGSTTANAARAMGSETVVVAKELADGAKGAASKVSLEGVADVAASVLDAADVLDL